MNKADKIFKDTMRTILAEGTKDKGPRPYYPSDHAPAHSTFITHQVHTYDIDKGELPIITLRPIAIKNAIKEILWIYQDQTSSLDILKNKYNIHWWDEWESKDRPGTIGQRYGATVKKYNLMNNLLEGIKKDPYGRRHIMNLWQEEDFKETDGLKPCAYETIWTVRGDYLDMSLTQRSSDFIVAGHINGMQYTALLMMVARHCGLKPGKFTHYIINLHLYDRHEENAKIMLEREPINCQPKLILNPEKTDFYSFTIDDFELVGYESVKPQLKFELAI
ncbi:MULTISPECIES: thymidylate synthase [unclassified Romboutsia]|uniref:thymidylate synthase n=1 Tax=unclassified Romboutsia TaxID=2626894 RepID=UPI0008232F91|nr:MULTISPECIES: thymidylate synthase [unclassified Romboutsia]SCI15890.1 Thymidylate synthase [uncultured Clostridium sp.]